MISLKQVWLALVCSAVAVSPGEPGVRPQSSAPPPHIKVTAAAMDLTLPADLVAEADKVLS